MYRKNTTRKASAVTILLMLAMVPAMAQATPGDGPHPPLLHTGKDDLYTVIAIPLPTHDAAANTGSGGNSNDISCSGMAPLVTSCQESTTAYSDMIFYIYRSQAFVGRITNEVHGPDFDLWLSCEIIEAAGTALDVDCDHDHSGDIHYGDRLTMTGTAESYSPLDGSPVGDWTVGIEFQ